MVLVAVGVDDADCLEAGVESYITPNSKARLIMLEQWRARAHLVNVSCLAHVATPHL